MENELIIYIANSIFIIFILFCAWFMACSIIYRDKSLNDDSNTQSDRQKKNDDYNTDYYI